MLSIFDVLRPITILQGLAIVNVGRAYNNCFNDTFMDLKFAGADPGGGPGGPGHPYFWQSYDFSKCVSVKIVILLFDCISTYQT